MTGRRRLLANAVILAILVGQLVAIAADRELWPFSPYSMYSDLRLGPVITRLWLYGVAADGAEAPLQLAMVRPYRFPQLETAFSRLQGADVQEGLRDVLARYEARRRAGRHPGPPLSALRVYRMTWTADPRVSNRDRPIERVLLAEAGAR